jgi:hypothetical protein
MKCKINATGCPYHACMSDDCQRAAAQKNGAEWTGDCEKQKNMEIGEFLERFMPHDQFLKYLASQGNGIKSSGEKAIKQLYLIIINFPEMIQKYTDEINKRVE